MNNTLTGENTKAFYNLDDTIDQFGKDSYHYNSDGYLETKTNQEGTTHYTYGSLGELKEVTLPNGDVITYEHNVNNQRVTKLKNGQVIERYLWLDLTTLLATFDKDGNIKQRYTYADGNIIKAVTYDSFGNIINDTNPNIKIAFGFAGGLYDSDTKLSRFGYRDYDSHSGKWTSKDPIGLDGGDSDILAYVGSDPVNFVEPTGLASTNTGDPVLNGLNHFLNAVENNWNQSNKHSIVGKIWNGMARDIPRSLDNFSSQANPSELLFDTFPKQGKKAYYNAHPAAQICLNASMTIFENGATAGMSNALSLPYDYYSGYNFNTYPTSLGGLLGWGMAQANE